MDTPEQVRISREEADSLLNRIEKCNLNSSDKDLLSGIIAFCLWIQNILTKTRTTLKKLRCMLGIIFEGNQSKKKKNGDALGLDIATNANTDDTNTNKASDNKPDIDNKLVLGGVNDTKEVTSHDSVDTSRPNHKGRNGAKDYPFAEHTVLPLDPSDTSGMHCKECKKGKMYTFKPGIILILEGGSLVKPTVYLQEKLRCNLCGSMIVAKLPEKAKEGKHSYSLIAQIALQKMLVGVPYHAQAEYHKLLNTPLPASTQWLLMEKMFSISIHIYNYFIFIAAQSWLCTYDDTRCPILEVKAENKELSENDRKGSNTTGFIFDSPEAPIALYISSRQHAGENLRDVLELRSKELGPMRAMGDGSSNNNPKDLELNIIMHNCLTHGMRKFTDLGDYYHEEGLKIIEFFSKVYKNDKHTKQLNMTAIERLAYHQKNSAPLIRDLKEYLSSLYQDKKKCEPNGELYGAIKYVLKRWEELTRFLTVAGAPLDSNSVEQLLKVIIRVRKVAMFFKTENSAFISSSILSLIKTSIINGKNPLLYLIAIQKHERDVIKHPHKWCPWNYEERLKEIEQINTS